MVGSLHDWWWGQAFPRKFSKAIIRQLPETNFVLHKTSKTIAAAAADYIQIITVVHACLMIQAIKIQKP
jgi:hypothetical protein